MRWSQRTRRRQHLISLDSDEEAELARREEAKVAEGVASKNAKPPSIAELLQCRAALQETDLAVWTRLSVTSCTPCADGRSGFKNTANNCYISSTLQAYAHTNAFLAWMSRRKCQCNEVNCPSCVLAWCFTSSSARVESPKLEDVWPSLVRASGLQWGAQHDGHDFIANLMNTWAKVQSATSQADRTSFYDRCLCVLENSTTKTPTCMCSEGIRTRTARMEELSMLQVSFSSSERGGTLQRRIDNFFCVEEVHGVSVADTCPACGARSRVEVQRALPEDSSRRLLPIYLKRGQVNGGKIRERVRIDRTLEIQEHYYHLRAVTQHLGHSAVVGHYIAWIFHPKEICVFDDTRTLRYNAAELPEFLEETAATLFFERTCFVRDVCSCERVLERICAGLREPEGHPLRCSTHFFLRNASWPPPLPPPSDPPPDVPARPENCGVRDALAAGRTFAWFEWTPAFEERAAGLHADIETYCPDVPCAQQWDCAQVLAIYLNGGHVWLRAAEDAQECFEGSLFEAYVKVLDCVPASEKLAEDLAVKAQQLQRCILYCMMPRLHLIFSAAVRTRVTPAFRGLSFRSEAEVRACVSVLAMHTGRTLQSYSMDVSVALKYARPALRKRTVMDRLVGEHGLEDLVHRPVGLCVVCLGFEGIPFCTWPNAPEKEAAEIWLHTPSVYVSEATNSREGARLLLSGRLPSDMLEIIMEALIEDSGVLWVCVATAAAGMEDALCVGAKPKAEETSSEEDEDAPDKDDGFEGEAALEASVYLPEGDHLHVFQDHVQGLLDVFQKQESLQDCQAYLAGLPSVAPELQRLGPRATLRRLQKGLASVCRSFLACPDAVTSTMPYWLCHDYRLSVLCEAASQASSLPAIFYVDAMRTSAMSLLNKDVFIMTSGYKCRLRPWFLGVADPGTGKSHAADPHCDIIQDACAAQKDYAIPLHDEGYHVLRTRTYAAFEHKMTISQGYGLCMEGEGHRLLCPSYPSRGTFDDTSGLRFDRMMDTTYGGKFGGETKNAREKAKSMAAAGKSTRVPFHAETNVCVGLVIQDSVWAEWWVCSESQRHEGLASRFTIAFARGRLVASLKYKNFFQRIYKPLVQKLFEIVLRCYSPNHDVLDAENPVGAFHMEDAEERLVKNARVAAQGAEPKWQSNRRKFSACLQKAGYYVPGVAWETCLLGAAFSESLNSSAGEADVPALTRLVTLDHVKSSMMFMWLRYAVGNVVLDNDIARSSWRGNNAKWDSEVGEMEKDIRLVLLQCPANVITLSALGWFCSRSFGDLLSRSRRTYNQCYQRILRLFSRMEEYRLGRCLGEGVRLRFQKRHASSLSDWSVDFLEKKLRVPLWIFGFHLPGSTLQNGIPVGESEQDGNMQHGSRSHKEAQQKNSSSGLPESPRSDLLAGDAGGARDGTEQESTRRGGTSWEAQKNNTSSVLAEVPRSGFLSGDAGCARHGTEEESSSRGETANQLHKQSTADATDARAGEPSANADGISSRPDGSSGGADAKQEGSGQGADVAKAKRRTFAGGARVDVTLEGPIATGRDGTRSLKAAFARKGLRIKWHCKGVEAGSLRYEGHCAETRTCPGKYLARIVCGETVDVDVRLVQEHAEHRGAEIGYGSIFTAAQQIAADGYVATCSAGAVHLKGLKHAFQLAKLSSEGYPEDSVLSSWVSRQNRAKQEQVLPGILPSAPTAPVLLLESALAPYKVGDVADVLDVADPRQLCVLPRASFQSTQGVQRQTQRGYIPFTCQGMLAKLKQLRKGAPLAFSVDAKVGKGALAWRTATGGFLTKGELADTTFRDYQSGQRVHCQGYTTKLEVFMQARMHQETNENWESMLRDMLLAVATVLECPEEEAASMVWQFSKDFNDSIEHARRKVLPNARPVGDPFHMFARFAIQLPAKCENAGTQEITAISKKDHSAQIHHAMKSFCYHAPTIDVLDVMLQYYLPQSENILHEKAAVDYLRQAEYVTEVSAEQMRSWHIPSRSSKKKKFWFCPSWQGLYGNHPGTNAGNEPAEAFNSSWAATLQSLGGRDAVAADMSTMQRIYQENKSFVRDGARTEELSMEVPHDANPALVNGQTLRKVGLSTAAEYWESRDSNHLRFDIDGISVLAFCDKAATDGTPPAKAQLNKADAEVGAKMIFAGDEDLIRLLFEAGVLYVASTSQVCVSVSSFEKVFADIAYVIVDGCPEHWHTPTYPLCTCRIFGTQQQCQHTLVTAGLGLPGVRPHSFASAPCATKRGRPRGGKESAPKRFHAG